MLKRINLGLCLIITSTLLYTGCSMHQLKEYTTYQLHDIKCEDDNINILLEKKRFSPKISASRAILGEIPSGTRYRLISYSLLTFNKKDMLEKDNAYISILNRKNIIKDKNIKYMNRLSIIDNNRIISWADFINDNPHRSLMFLDNNKKNTPITNNDKSIYYSRSFDNKKILYLLDNKMFIYDIDELDTYEYLDSNLGNINSEKFEHSNFMADNGKWFFDHVADDIDTMSFVFELVDKENSTVLSEFITKSDNFQDFNNKLENGRLLTYDHRYGLEIIDLKGNSLYSLQDESLKYASKAVMHNGKVYAAGITTKNSRFGKKDHIIILQWDYKNDSVIKKYYPCDSPEPEM